MVPLGPRAVSPKPERAAARPRWTQLLARKAENAKRREGKLSASAANSCVVFGPLFDLQLPVRDALRTVSRSIAREF